jgi:hypothetical protein
MLLAEALAARKDTIAEDDIRELPTVDRRVARRTVDELSETIRRLDLALQQRNWTTELIELRR